jgi:alpha-tubulin suppressor-like RCC1 family protein
LQGNDIWSAWNGYNPLVGNSNIISSDVGLEHTAFITSGNRLYVFGNNDSGQLGNNSTINQGLSIASRRTITGLYTGETLTKVYAMERGTLVLTSFGRLFVFGRNANGQLGTNSLTYELIPVMNSLNLQNVTFQLGHGLNIRNKLPQLQKDGFLFLGYYYDKEFTNQLSTGQLMPTSDIMLYAKWS